MLDDFTHEWTATHLAAIINALGTWEEILHLSRRKTNKRLELLRRIVRSPALSSSPSSPDFLIGQNSRKKNLGGIRNVERGKSGMGTAETGFHHQTRADAGATANANDQKKCRMASPSFLLFLIVAFPRVDGVLTGAP